MIETLIMYVVSMACAEAIIKGHELQMSSFQIEYMVACTGVLTIQMMIERFR